MLEVIGVRECEDLLSSIPENILLKQELKLPDAISELELVRLMRKLAGKNANVQEYACFLGGGAYDHFIPSTVDHVIRRSEFYTAYTQYQPELSQGYLQALWEYQSMICALTGMEVANASMYDGGTAAAEAVMMAAGITGRSEVVVYGSIHPHYKKIITTYGKDFGYNVIETPLNNGASEINNLKGLIGKNTAAVIIQNPNFFGCLENMSDAVSAAHSTGALAIAVVDPISLGILKPPGEYGIDIVVGEGQSLGLGLCFGGPYLGFFATTQQHIRKMPGRIVGQTVDLNDRRGFVLTLQAREQHIRREKATSNICSNEALCALAVSVYLSTVGKDGLYNIALQSLQKAHYAYDKLMTIDGCTPVFSAPFFKEFAIKLSRPVKEVNKALYSDNIIGGLDLEKYDERLKNCMLIAVTEKRTRAEIDKLAEILGAIL